MSMKHVIRVGRGLAFSIMMLVSIHASAECTYYVDAINGVDVNPGTSESQAWKSLDKVFSFDSGPGFSPGNVICFRKGQRFYRAQNGKIYNNGAEGNPIKFTSYGPAGETTPPVLSPAERIDNKNGWVDQGDGRWLFTYTGSVANQIWENGKSLAKATTPNLTNGQWYLAAGTGIYYRPSTGIPSTHEVHLSYNGLIFGIEDRSYLTFEGLSFEFAGNVIYGKGKVAPIHHITFRNNVIKNTAAAIELASLTVDGVPHENHDIVVDSNVFDNIRFAVKLYSQDMNINTIVNNTKTRSTNIFVTNNTVRNVAIDGAYTLADSSPDVEVLSFQNLHGSEITSNDIRDGVKQSHGLYNAGGKLLSSIGVIIWVHSDQTIKNVRIERNRIDNMGLGIVIGATQSYRLINDTIANNIISNCEQGVRLNAGDSGDNGSMTGVIHNTFFNNNISMYLNSGARNYQIKEQS